MKKYSILAVDDEEIILRTLDLDLEEEGYEVTMANNGEEAVRKIDGKDFDMLITDLMMEGIDGLQVLKAAKNKIPDIMALVLTGYGSLTSAIDALRLGASDYMLKPYDKSELLMRVGNCIEKLEFKRKVKCYENILPMCGMCKKIRDDSVEEPGKGVWVEVEDYLIKKSKVDISHGFCEDCHDKMKTDTYLEKQNKIQDMNRLAK